MSRADFTAQQTAIASAVVELDRPKIEVGQVWRCRDGRERTVLRSRGHNDSHPWQLSDGEFVTASGRDWSDGTDGPADLIELIKDASGFTIWRGGEQPKETRGKVVSYRMREDIEFTPPNEANHLRWDHRDTSSDVVAYKVVETAAEAPAAIGIDPGAKDGDHTVIAMMYAVSGAAKDAREYTGGKVNYYEVQIESPTHEGREPYIAECNDIIEALDMSFAEGEAFKAIWRGAAARKNLAKRGYTDGLYDAEKVTFYGGRMVVQEKSRREKSLQKD